ncbi:MAG: hypothetical protein KDD40_13075, partial [Bdellovibrionales bacterium]|nr:hypothetical protein [Bdellovibrionales bacterium]
NLLKPGLKLSAELENSQGSLELSVSDFAKDGNDVFLYVNRKPFIYKTFKTVAEKWNVKKSDFIVKEKEKTETEPMDMPTSDHE